MLFWYDFLFISLFALSGSMPRVEIISISKCARWGRLQRAAGA